jgi:hypothetical protein
MMMRLLLAAVFTVFLDDAISGETDSLKNYIGWDQGISVKRKVFGKYLVGLGLWSDFNRDETDHWEKSIQDGDTLGAVFRDASRDNEYRNYRFNLSLQRENRIFAKLFLNPFLELGYTHAMSKRRWQDPGAAEPPHDNSETHGLLAGIGVEPTLQIAGRVFLSTKFEVESAKRWTEGRLHYSNGGGANTSSGSYYGEIIEYRYLGLSSLMSMQVAAHFAFD